MKTFIEVGTYQISKKGQGVCGDAFSSMNIPGEDRLVSVLADGLGSGIKASVLAILTTTIATRLMAHYRNIRQPARVVMSTLPICSERKISYSAFSIVDIENRGTARVMEYGTPSFLLFRGNQPVGVSKEDRSIAVAQEPDRTVQYSQFSVQEDDRLIFFSDGVSQSGMGERATPLGWGEAPVARFVQGVLKEQPQVSARELARRIAVQALKMDHYGARDDITCGVLYLRQPRVTLLVSGPPIRKERDADLAERVRMFPGRTIVCGGTTANIVSRQLGRPVVVDMTDVYSDVPPSSHMEGVTLVTEGILTLCRVVELLERPAAARDQVRNAAQRVVDCLLDSDQIAFLVGTKINEVHQDPNMPVEIEIRRNIVKKIKAVLEEKYLKQVTLEYI